jgi:hypothetical protein
MWGLLNVGFASMEEKRFASLRAHIFSATAAFHCGSRKRERVLCAVPKEKLRTKVCAL